MRKILFVALLASAIVSFADTLGVWTFSEGAEGASVETVANSLQSGINAIGKVGSSGELPVFSADAPGKYLFSDANCTEVLCNGLKSAIINGNRIEIPITSSLVNARSWTIEMFVKVGASCTIWKNMLTLRCGEMVKISNDRDSSNPSICVQNTRQNTSDMMKASSHRFYDSWQHFALVYDDGKKEVAFYANYVLVGAVPYKLAAESASGHTLILGSDINNISEMIGAVSAVRVTTGLLAPSEMMRVGMVNNSVDCGDTLGFWPAADVTAGDSVTTASLTNSFGMFNYSAVIGSNGKAKPLVYSDDVPGKKIYSSSAKTRVLTDNLHSISFDSDPASTSTGYGIGFYALANDMLAGENGFTIEAFYKFDTNIQDWWRNVFSFDVDGNRTSRFKYAISTSCQCRIQRQSLDLLVADGLSVLGKWYHSAIVYDRGTKTMTMYVNYVKIAEASDVELPAPISCSPFALGSSVSIDGEFMRGKIAGLRITKRNLSVSDMMVASDVVDKNYVNTIAYYDFSEGTVGDNASFVQNKINKLKFVGRARTLSGGDYPVYSDDVPGRYVYSSHSSGVILTDCLKSMYFNGNDPTSSSVGSLVYFAGLGSALYDGDNNDYTVEFFFKHDSKVSQYWRTACNVPDYGGSKMGGWRVRLPTASMSGISLQTCGGDEHYKENGAYSTLTHDVWHHMAVVRKDGITTLYYDYRPTGRLSSIQTPNAGGKTSMSIGGNLASNNEAFCGNIASLRVTRGALEPVNMMYATDDPNYNGAADKTLLHWSFDDGADGARIVKTGCRYLKTALKGSAVGGFTNDSKNPTYDHDAISVKKLLLDGFGGEELGENVSCARFYGKEGDITAEWAGSWVKTSPNIHPDLASFKNAFTLEMFVKPSKTQAYTALLFAYAEDTALNGFAVKLFIQTDASIVANVVQASSESYEGTVENLIWGPVLTPKWHHVALTFDAVNKKMEMFVDYKLYQSKELPRNTPILTSGNWHCFAGRGANARGFNGWLDEIRLTADVLPSDKFLRLVSKKGFSFVFR